MTIKLTTPAAVAASLAAMLASAPANAAEYVQAPGSTLAFAGTCRCKISCSRSRPACASCPRSASRPGPLENTAPTTSCVP